jgi:glycosyltransferase involved in cell wall biosynthesis
MKILCVHQSADLYGSDRSFAQSVGVLKNTYPDSTITIILPKNGPLVDLLHPISDHIIFEDVGSFARRDLKVKPLKVIVKLFKSVIQARKRITEADLVYVNTLVVFGYLLASIFTKNTINHIREVPSKFESMVFSFLFFINRSTLIFNSKYTSNSFYILGNNNYVVYNGVPKQISITSNVLSEQIKLVLVGRINSWKGHKLAINALSILIANGALAKLRIVGSTAKDQGFYLDDLKVLVNSLNLNKYIEFCDFQDDPKEHYEWSNIVLVPSTNPEPFGRVAIEGMSYGRVVIAANHGGLSEILENSMGGVLFEPSSVSDLISSIELFLNNKELILSKSDEAYNVFNSKFSESNYIDNLKNVFINLPR